MGRQQLPMPVNPQSYLANNSKNIVGWTGTASLILAFNGGTAVTTNQSIGMPSDPTLGSGSGGTSINAYVKRFTGFTFTPSAASSTALTR
jgi:hypothetical protein